MVSLAAVTGAAAKLQVRERSITHHLHTASALGKEKL